MEGPASLNSKSHDTFYNGAHFVRPISSLRVNEFDLVRGLLQILQGKSSPLFIWDNDGQRYNVKVGICIAHLSLSSLYNILNQFLYAASCLRLVGDIVSESEISVKSPPTLRAFSSSVSVWLKRLRNIALKEEVKIIDSNSRTVPTLLGFANTLSSLCSGAEYLLQIVNEAIPHVYHDSVSSVPAVEVAVHILDYLYKKLHDVCLVQGGEEEAYLMLVYLFVGSSLPYMGILDSWLYEGILDDPFDELFFYENKAVSIDDAEFWEKRYLLRSLRQKKSDAELCSITDWRSQTNLQACPLFIKEMAKLIVSAGKSLQLIRHFPSIPDSSASCSGNYNEIDDGESLYGAADFGKALRGHITAGLTLSEVFCVSLAGLIGHGDHVFSKLQQEDFHSLIILSVGSETKNGEGRQMSGSVGSSQKIWLELLADALHGKNRALKADGIVSHREESEGTGLECELQIAKSFCPENPVITVSQLHLHQKRNAWMDLNLPINIQLPPLNDDDLRESIFSTESGMELSARGTDYVFGFQFNESEYKRSQEDRRVLKAIFPFPTILPSSQEDQFMSELLPFQKNSTLSSKFLRWIKDAEPKATPLPAVIFDECLLFYIKRQVDYIGSHMLSKLLREWRLMDELAVLRAIYLLGSGDLLQHFFTIIFNKLDKGESWDDDFELNMILQESITNSADRMLLSAPDSLIASLAKPHDVDIRDQNNSNNVSTPRRSHDHNSGINGLDTLNFSYKVSWPLELIANSEAIKKYNQVMRFLLKVKRAKFVLDKARKWIWKGRGTVTVYAKHHWLVEQKLLHFVDAFHQYVMDRVYCSAWRELCKGMAAARSLDEVMQVHEAYLLSIQRQCFVVPDKLWALIASRINTILGLALDFYSIQQTLNSGGAVSAIKARCVMEVDRIEKQFDECITFLLRVLSFKLNVGHFPHLADLVTRINYNYYYMSDSGNMITAPRSEAVKLQKAFSRTTS